MGDSSEPSEDLPIPRWAWVVHRHLDRICKDDIDKREEAADVLAWLATRLGVENGPDKSLLAGVRVVNKPAVAGELTLRETRYRPVLVPRGSVAAASRPEPSAASGEVAVKTEEADESEPPEDLSAVAPWKAAARQESPKKPAVYLKPKAKVLPEPTEDAAQDEGSREGSAEGRGEGEGSGGQGESRAQARRRRRKACSQAWRAWSAEGGGDGTTPGSGSDRSSKRTRR